MSTNRTAYCRTLNLATWLILQLAGTVLVMSDYPAGKAFLAFLHITVTTNY
jgi:hypothetical protein